MIRFGVVLSGVVLLSACCVTQERTSGWTEYTNTVQQYSESQLKDAQKAALLRDKGQPDDESRMQLAWLLSQGNPSQEQLERSLELTREVSSDGLWAAQRNLLQLDLQNLIELHTTRGRVLELEAQLETKYTQLVAMQDQLAVMQDQLAAMDAQLKAMKDIEARRAEDIDPDRKVPK